MVGADPLLGLSVGTAAWWRGSGCEKKECGPGRAEWEAPRPRPGSGRGRGGRKGASDRPPCAARPARPAGLGAAGSAASAFGALPPAWRLRPATPGPALGALAARRLDWAVVSERGRGWRGRRCFVGGALPPPPRSQEPRRPLRGRDPRGRGSRCPAARPDGLSRKGGFWEPKVLAFSSYFA